MAPYVQYSSSSVVRKHAAATVILGAVLILTGCGGGTSGAGNGGNPAPFVSFSANPSSLITYPSSTFTITITAGTNTSSTPSLTSISLPTGFSTSATFPLTVPNGGVQISFQTSSTVAQGTYTLTLNGQAASATSSTKISATLQTNPPTFFFVTGLFSEVAVPFGGSGSMQFFTEANSGTANAFYSVQLAVSGLPPGTKATISPPTIMPGQSATVTVTADSTAPESQNVSVTLTGTPLAPVAPASTSFLVDVTPKPGSLPDNRTDYVSTEATPYAAVYDPAHQLIFATNDTWNRVEVISATTHALVSRIPIREPRGVDITQDNSTVWVASGSRQMFSINTSTLAVTRYLLPSGSVGYWEGSQLLVLGDGTMMIVTNTGRFTSPSGLLLWNPATKALTTLNSPNPEISLASKGIFRSGNGERVYFISGDSSGLSLIYDVATKSFSNTVTLGGFVLGAAVNVDGSRIYVCDGNGPNMYDSNLNLIGPVPACAAPLFFQGGSVFSSDNRYLYLEVLAAVPSIIKVDTSSLNIVSVAPAMPFIPVMTELSTGYFLPDPFAVDSTGMVLGIEDWGIAFDDSTYAQNYSPQQGGAPTFLQHMDPYFGPLAGGTTSGGFGNAFSITPDVWYGANHGSAALNGDTLSITSPPSTIPGPLHVKMIFPDGVEVFDPLFFSYGPFLQYALISGAPPDGNVSGQVVGYGMPGDDKVTGSLDVGGSNAALGLPGSSGLPFAGTVFPNKILSYTVPPGTPGWADLKLTTGDGTSTLPKSFFYAKSVTDYASPDSFTAVLHDSTRQRLYLSAGNHIDVFSLTANQFVTPLGPPSVGNTPEFTGLALTPDGSLLLATDLLDGSLAVISPDNPSTNYVVPIAPVGTNGNPGCNVGPLYVAATNNSQAFVVTGGIEGNACGPGGALYIVDLGSHTATTPGFNANCGLTSGAGYVSATKDGSKVVIGGSIDRGGFCIYDVASKTYTSNSSFQTYGGEFSADGNVAASEFVFTDSTSNVIGRVGRPDVYYDALGGSNSAQPNLVEPQLNDAGSLYYMAFPNFFDIVDVQHGILRMRFSLNDTISTTVVPMAIDSGGRFVFLITNTGLTIVDLGEAPLSVGWVSAANAAAGTQITVRGSGFNSSTTATVNSVNATVSLVDQNTLALSIPDIAPGPATIVLTNADDTTYRALEILTIQ